MLGLLTVVTAAICAQALPISEELYNIPGIFQQRDIVARIAEDGFYAEAHTVTTSDGYILEVNRIPFGRNEERNHSAVAHKPVVYLMHGLQNSALAYITLGVDRSLAYMLADAGYDVWIGNARGVLNSRRHVTLDPNNPNDLTAFFDYTFEDIGMKDLPAIIDYILEFTGNSQLHYVGHSQGGTAFLVLNSMLPEYHEKFISAHILAGVGYQDNFPTPSIHMIAITTDTLYEFALRVGLIELLGPSWNEVLLGECSKENPAVCGIQALEEIMGDLFASLEMISGASIKQYAHYGQNIKSKSFRRWDYGFIQNMLQYGRFSPPEYDITQINVDCTMHYTLNDILLDEEDVLAMAASMPKTNARKLERTSFTHTDFVISSDAKELVYDYILEALNKY